MFSCFYPFLIFVFASLPVLLISAAQNTRPRYVDKNDRHHRQDLEYPVVGLPSTDLHEEAPQLGSVAYNGLCGT